jgi:phenylpyruvate tautomerase PptA (4-oxalocrotonate tautomerase family)
MCASRCLPRLGADRDKQIGVVRELTDIAAAAASDPSMAERTWVLITESPDGGWGIAGAAMTGADITAAARAGDIGSESLAGVSLSTLSHNGCIASGRVE